jgi:hypothetical protein
MASRLELQEFLEELTEVEVYFQQPTDIEMQYPCIIYKRDDSWSEHADNQPYAHAKRYEVTVIDRNPDSELPDTVEALRYCSFARAFATEGLNHYVFNLFF